MIKASAGGGGKGMRVAWYVLHTIGLLLLLLYDGTMLT
jgi:hypothetical protein